jgi:predicted oxidoreductase
MYSNKIKISPNGLELSRIVAGVWKWGVWGWQMPDQAHLALIEKCLEYGATTFDHADIYGHYTSEGDFGRALKLNPSLRQKMQLVTKCGIKLTTPNRPLHTIKSYDTSKEHIIWSAENSLKELNTDRIDLMLIHRPSPLMDADEIAEAFTALQQAGKVLHFGVSNFTTTQFDLLNSRIKLATNQVEIHLMRPEPFLDGTLDQCQQHRIAPMAWSPLSSGSIFTNLEEEQVQRIRKAATPLMEKYSIALDQLLIAWLLKHPSHILPILGTARPERVLAAVEALKIELTDEEWFVLWEAAQGREVP